MYFVTICTKNREHFFGEIVNWKMILSEIWLIVQKYWLEIPNHFPFVLLNEFVVIQNHMHWIIVINNAYVETLRCNVSTLNKFNKNYFYSIISPKPKSLSTIIRSYKSICTKTINKIQKKIFFSWQSRFYDRIIHNEKELNYIRKYIKKNPVNWIKNKNNYKNLWM
jgi:putative transposase